MLAVAARGVGRDVGATGSPPAYGVGTSSACVIEESVHGAPWTYSSFAFAATLPKYLVGARQPIRIGREQRWNAGYQHLPNWITKAGGREAQLGRARRARHSRRRQVRQHLHPGEGGAEAPSRAWLRREERKHRNDAPADHRMAHARVRSEAARTHRSPGSSRLPEANLGLALALMLIGARVAALVVALVLIESDWLGRGGATESAAVMVVTRRRTLNGRAMQPMSLEPRRCNKGPMPSNVPRTCSMPRWQ